MSDFSPVFAAALFRSRIYSKYRAQWDRAQEVDRDLWNENHAPVNQIFLLARLKDEIAKSFYDVNGCAADLSESEHNVSVTLTRSFDTFAYILFLEHLYRVSNSTIWMK